MILIFLGGGGAGGNFLKGKINFFRSEVVRSWNSQNKRFISCGNEIYFIFNLEYNMNDISKVHMFWESHKILTKSPVKISEKFVAFSEYMKVNCKAFQIINQ